MTEGRRFRRDASASRRNREGEPGASALGSPERPRLPTRSVPRAETQKAGGRVGGDRRPGGSRERLPQAASPRKRPLPRAILPGTKGGEDPGASRMRRSEAVNSTADDGRPRLPHPSFVPHVPRSAGRTQWSLRFRAAGRGRPVTVSREESVAERSWPEARTVISGRRGRRFRRDASASRRNREGEPGVSPGSPERLRLPTRSGPRA